MNNIINENLIQEIYEKYITPKLNQIYENKYSELPMEYNDSNWNWDHKDFSRVISLLEFKDYMDKNPRVYNNALISNGTNDPELRFLKYKNISHIDYEKNKKYDLHDLNLNEKYDFFMCNQTLEHTYDPCLILRNIFNIMEDGGVVYVNVPALCPPHNTPHHYYNGFTPVGLGCILKQAGFTILDIGYWGNKDFVTHLFNTNDWPDYRMLKNYKNDFKYAAISWIFAIK
jgi:hypothetical protein